MEKGEIVTYKPDRESIQLEVRIEKETVWLTQAQIAELFGTKRQAITRHLKNIFSVKELDEKSVVKEYLTTAKDGKEYPTQFYNLDAIISVGYRVNSVNATQFRIWATQTLKNYLLKGYAISHRIENLERKVSEHDKRIESLVQLALPPKEGIFFDGQIFDAYEKVISFVKSAKKSIVLIDNYVDESVLIILSKRASNVRATIFTASISKQLELDLKRFNAQYPTIMVKTFTRSHDRFLIIDNATIYHIGASLKDLGKKWFAFSKIELDATEMIIKLN